MSKRATLPTITPERAFLCLMFGVVASLSGCKSAAHTDVYVDKLAAEVRFLEDQLYEVDYENKVLREKLARAKRAGVLEPPRESRSLSKSVGAMLGVEPSGSSIDSEEPEELVPPRAQLGAPDIPTPDIQLPDVDGGGILPPDPADLNAPEIDLGDLIPPGGASVEPREIPGQVIVPASAKQHYQEPAGKIAKLKINRAFSRGFTDRDRNETSGVAIVIEGFDERGNSVPVESAIDIAILDPERDPTEARLGRWNFTTEQTLNAQGANQSSPGVRFELMWDEKSPAGKSVLVYCRLRHEDGQIQADELVYLKPGQSTAQVWTPRAVTNR